MATKCFSSRRYADLMKLIWQHPDNNQRPPVLRLLESLNGQFLHVLDIGSGDAYYLPNLNPKTYTIVEPNSRFRRISLEMAQRLGVESTYFRDIDSLFSSKKNWKFDIVLLVHVLLYLSPREIRLLLESMSKMPLVIVHPLPRLSTTIKFETSIEEKGSLEKIQLKESILGVPRFRRVIHSHLRLPIEVDEDMITFLIAHRALLMRPERKCELVDSAKKYVNKRVTFWKHNDYFNIPQGEVIEVYNVNPKSLDRNWLKRERPEFRI